jgi:hypothetical protein
LVFRPSRQHFIAYVAVTKLANSPQTSFPPLPSLGQALRGGDGICGLLQHPPDDAIENTDATPEVLESHDGVSVRFLVEGTTDDKASPKAEHKRLQVKHDG